MSKLPGNISRQPGGYPDGGEFKSHKEQQDEARACRQSPVLEIPVENAPPLTVQYPAHRDPVRDATIIERAPYDENGVSVGFSTYSIPV